MPSDGEAMLIYTHLSARRSALSLPAASITVIVPPSRASAQSAATRRRLRSPKKKRGVREA